MNYKNSKFYVENISIGKLTRSFQTPFYCYSKSRLSQNIKNFNKNFEKTKPLICFSVKSNSNSKLLKIIKDNGLGADVVSIGELQKVLKVGFKPNKIVFSGVGKTTSELDFAIKKKILLINVESESELKNVINLSKNKKTIVNVGIRLNPNVNAQTIGKISTGRMQDKFGLTFKDAIKIIDKYKNSNSIRFKCLSVHIGSQILSNVPYQKMIRVVNNFLEKVSVNFEYVDFGGGMGIDYSSNKKNSSFHELLIHQSGWKPYISHQLSLIKKNGKLKSRFIDDESSKKRIQLANNLFIKKSYYNKIVRKIKRTKIEPKIGPMQGVQPKANAIPIKIGL